MIEAIALAVSTTVGAGVLGLPKTFQEVGLLGLVLILFPALAIYSLSLLILDMLKKENRPVQLISLISDAIGGRAWKYITYFTLIFSMYGALTAYLIGFGDQLNVLLGLKPFTGSLLLFLTGSFIVLRGTKIVARFERPFAFLIVLFLLLVSLLNLLNMSYFPPIKAISLHGAVTFMGVALFALSSINVLPEVNYLAKGRAERVILYTLVITLSLYLLFAFSTVGVLGDNVTDLGTKGLAAHYGGWFNAGISIFTLLALFSSFLGIGLSLRHIYNFDFNFSKPLSTALAVLPPFFIYLFSLYTGTGFLGVLSIAGEITLPIFSLTAVYAFVKSFRKSGTSLKHPWLVTAFTAAFYSLLLIFSVLSYVKGF